MKRSRPSSQFYPDTSRPSRRNRLGNRRRRKLKEIDVMGKDELLFAFADRLPLIVIEDYERGLTWVQLAPKGWEGFNGTIDYAEFKRLAEGLPPLRNSEQTPER